MANICSTQYVFIGEEKDILRLAEDINRAVNNPERSEYDRYWCLYLATELLGEDKDKTKLYLRGEYFLEEVGGTRLRLSTSTAWEPCYRLFSLLADKYHLQHYWMAEETGNRGYWTNDTNGQIWEYAFVVRDEDYCEHFFSSLSEARRFYNQIKEMDGVEFYQIERWEE